MGKELNWGLNPNATKGVGAKQVVVASNNARGVTVYSQGENSIVFGIAARGDGCNHVHPFRFA